MLDIVDIKEALYSATTVEPKGIKRLNRGSRLLGEWKTCNPRRTTSMIRLHRQIIAFLRDIDETITVGELRDLLEELDLES